MRIKDFSWLYAIDNRPDVELHLVDITPDELFTLRNLAIRGDKIKIESAPFPTDVRPITTNGFITDYVKEMYRSKIEVTLRDIKVEKVIFNKPATIVFWSDNTKTVVICGKDDTYDKEKGFYIACAKKLFGNDFKAIGRMNKALEKAIVQID